VSQYRSSLFSHIIEEVSVHDLRFPTSRDLSGSDAMHPDPDYSAAYVTIRTTDPTLSGYGLTFTLGRGNELCTQAIQLLAPSVIGGRIGDLFGDMGALWKKVTGDSQLRFVGPEKGVIHMAAGALINAVWDLYARVESKPLWRLIIDMTPDQLVASIPFEYIEDALTPEEALAILRQQLSHRESRLTEIEKDGYPAYTTSVGWLGYSDEKIRQACRRALNDGWTRFKVKVGADLDRDKGRLAIVREEIGPKSTLMLDANQVWSVDEAIAWTNELARFEPFWIEEPTSPDDLLGHARIAREVAPIRVASGECCHNRVMFKQFLQAGAMGICQPDSCRLAGVNEVLAVLLMATKFGVPVCFHAGGVGLAEHVQHLALVNYIAIGGPIENGMCEYTEHLHEHFVAPVRMRRGRYLAPVVAGYGVEMKSGTLARFEYPRGEVWASSHN